MTYPNVQLLINNEWRPARSNATIPVHNPADGSVIGSVARASVADLDDALAAAAKGFQVWRNTPALERSKVMRAAAGLLRQRADAIATMMTMEQGKPLAESKAEIGMAADITEWFADESRRVYGRLVPPRAMNQQQMVLKEPVGPVAAFTPWNFPINQVVRKLSGALATGCSMIVKAAEETPASPAELIRAFVDAGLPAGVVGLVYGDPAEISNYLIPHPVIRKITFTGSTPVGKRLTPPMRLTAPTPGTLSSRFDTALSTNQLKSASSICWPGAVAATKVSTTRPAVDDLVTEGSRSSPGRSARTRATASRTSLTASDKRFSRTNSTVISTAPSSTLVWMFLMPCSVAIESSSLRATSVSSCAGAAPENVAWTVTMGSSMSGKSCTALDLYDSKPASVSSTNSMMAGIGFLMESEEKFIAAPYLIADSARESGATAVFGTEFWPFSVFFD